MIATGQGTHVEMSAIIHDDATIGPGCRIGAHVYIGPGVTVGLDCVIKAGAVIGGDGFGYERDGDGRWAPKAHEYGVLIGDDVHIGAGTCVDRGSWRHTYIAPGARVDNLVHVAHNVEIGLDAAVVAHAMLGGSCEVGAGAWIGPSASVKQRVKVGARALVGMGAVVLKDVPENVTVAGNPARIINADVGVRDEM